MMLEQNNSFTVPSIVREGDRRREGDVVLHRAEFDDFIKYQIVIERYAMTNGARASKTKSISTLNNFFSGWIDVFAEGRRLKVDQTNHSIHLKISSGVNTSKLWC